MRKGFRVFVAASLFLVLFSGSAAFAASRDSQDTSVFARFLSWVLYSRLFPPSGAPVTAPEPPPEPQGRLSPPIGLADPPATP